MGIQCDLLFGLVVLFGLGGIFVEVLQDVVFCCCLFEVDEVEVMICSIRGVLFLFGVCGWLWVDVVVLVWLLLNFLWFVWEVGECLCLVDFNLVIVLLEGQGVWVVDVVLEVEEVVDGV